MVSADLDFLNTLRPKYAPIRIGESTQKSRLDAILEAARVDRQNYILFVEAF